MIADRIFACLLLRAPSTESMRSVLDAICPPLEWPGRIVKEYGSCRALVFVPQTTASASRVPNIARHAADLAYGLGATRVEYFNEAMEQVGKGPRRLRTGGSPPANDRSGDLATADHGPMTARDLYPHQVVAAHFEDRASANKAAMEAGDLMVVDGPAASGSGWLVAVHLPSPDGPETLFPDPHLLARIERLIKRHGGVVT